MHAINTTRHFPMQLEIRDLRLITAIAHAGSLTGAARVLHLTQSTLSHHLAQLEGRVDKALFYRSGRRMFLTPVGKCFQVAATPILEQMELMEKELADDAVLPNIELRFATECYTTYPWFGPVAREFKIKYPKVDLKLITEATARPMIALERGSIDIAITSSRRHDKSLHSENLFSDEIVAVVAKDHPWAQKKRVALEEFRDAHFMTYSANPMDSDFVREVLLPAGIVPRKASGIQLTEGIFEFARACLGVAVVARWALGSLRDHQGLVSIRIGRHGIQRNWKAAWMRSHPDSKMLKNFARLLCSRRGSS